MNDHDSDESEYEARPPSRRRPRSDYDDWDDEPRRVRRRRSGRGDWDRRARYHRSRARYERDDWDDDYDDRLADPAISAPAKALFVCWIFGAVVALVFVLVAIFSVAQGRNARREVEADRPILVMMGLIYPLAAGAGLYGAWEMMHFRSHPWATASACLLMLAFMGCTPALGIGIWALVVLHRPATRRAFGDNRG
ncbi:hypothetical protein VT84_21095 [Gemmata sp. SH-PL17]|uniref:hypothetical protein n=1 Tax=Gemmata sp. SH-PL17 TaxID=1630693 RepID=UPI00078D9033|nr:hypothetical protein [Gemmata sp. SH-PL17]AMV26911.1 hypothetical protein VT84_21095 [Gemmata sp. SH-PL17]